MIDMRQPIDKQLFLQHQGGLSLKAHEIISIRPQMQAEQLTDFKFKSSIHFTEDRILHLVGPNKEDEQVLFGADIPNFLRLERRKYNIDFILILTNLFR